MVKKLDTLSAAPNRGLWIKRTATLNPLSRLWLALVRYRRNQKALHHLSQLPDELLDDVGLDRTKADRMFNRSLIAHYRDNLNDIGRRY